MFLPHRLLIARDLDIFLMCKFETFSLETSYTNVPMVVIDWQTKQPNLHRRDEDDDRRRRHSGFFGRALSPLLVKLRRRKRRESFDLVISRREDRESGKRRVDYFPLPLPMRQETITKSLSSPVAKAAQIFTFLKL